MPRYYKEIKKDGKAIGYIPLSDVGSKDSSDDKIISMTSPKYIYEKLLFKLTRVEDRTNFFDTATTLLHNVFIIAGETTNENEKEKTLKCIQTILDAYRSILRSTFYSPTLYFGTPTDTLPNEIAEFCRDTLFLKLPTELEKSQQLKLDDSLVIDTDKYRQIVESGTADILNITPRSSI